MLGITLSNSTSFERHGHFIFEIFLLLLFSHQPYTLLAKVPLLWGLKLCVCRQRQ